MRAVDGAEVIDLISQRETRTDAYGAFRLVGLPPGSHLLTVRRIGFQRFTTGVNVPSRETVDLDVRLARTVPVLDSVVVAGERTVLEGPAGFRWRALHGTGHYVTRAEIEQRGAMNAREALSTLASVRVDPVTGQPYFPRAGYVDATGARCANAIVMLDGVAQDSFDLRDVPAHYIAGIEVYAGPSTIPLDLRPAGSGACGLVAIWTR